MKRSALPILFAVALAACQPAPATAPVPADDKSAIAQRPTLDVQVSTKRAIQLFDAICGATLDDRYVSARARMAQNGVSLVVPDAPNIFSKRENLSFVIERPGKPGAKCQMVWGNFEPRAQVLSGVGAINPLKPAGGALLTNYRETGKILVLTDGIKMSNGAQLYRLTLFAGR